jgi:hypothetical protein
MPKRRLLVLLAVLPALAACGGSSSSSPSVPTIQAARTFQLAGFQPSAAPAAGKPVTISFAIQQPDGKPLTNYRRGSGPHTGIHLILVRSDLSTIVHKHPPIGPGGRVSEQIVFPAGGTYRLVVDAYPNTTGPQRNFQLFRTIRVTGPAGNVQRLSTSRQEVDVGGYRVQLLGRPKLKAIQAGFLDVTVTGPDAKPARFTPWFGALAHAIFFRAGTLDYFHTHVCAPGASGCTSALGGATVSGSSSTPGKLRVGVLVPVSGTWRLFLQFKANGHVITAPFTLKVA